MRALNRDIWLALGLFVVLVGITIAAAIYQTQELAGPPLASFSNAPDGARALRQWLDRTGYTTSDAVSEDFRLPEDTTLVLMLEPNSDFGPSVWEEIDGWVAAGGTLLLAGNGWGTLLAVEHFDFQLVYSSNIPAELAAQTPLFTSPPLTTTVPVQSRAFFRTARTDYVTHLSAEDGPVLVSFEQDKGRVILCATAFPFSNAGLKEAGNPTLVLNLLAAARAPEGARQRGQVWFDEWHHGVRPSIETVTGPEQWLLKTPAGQALLFSAGVIFLALLLQGRNFGRPVPMPQELSRRTPLEFITALANLNRRAGHRMSVLRLYHQWLKRELGRRYRLDPTLPDAEYVAQLAHFRPHLDTTALSSLLMRLHQPAISENEMVQIARETAEWVKET